MGVVYKYLCPSHIRNFFETTWDSSDFFHDFDDCFDTHFLRYEYCYAREDIHHVEFSLKFGVYMEEIGRHTHIEADPTSMSMDIFSTD